jgi:hypothetical protein
MTPGGDGTHSAWVIKNDIDENRSNAPALDC